MPETDDTTSAPPATLRQRRQHQRDTGQLPPFTYRPGRTPESDRAAAQRHIGYRGPIDSQGYPIPNPHRTGLDLTSALAGIRFELDDLASGLTVDLGDLTSVGVAQEVHNARDAVANALAAVLAAGIKPKALAS